MMKFSNNCKTWWNSQTIAKHDEITPHEHNCKLSWNSQTISQHGEIHKQLHTHTTSLNTTPQIHKSNTLTTPHDHNCKLHNMVKYTNHCTTCWNTQTIAVHSEIHKTI